MIVVSDDAIATRPPHDRTTQGWRHGCRSLSAGPHVGQSGAGNCDGNGGAYSPISAEGRRVSIKVTVVEQLVKFAAFAAVSVRRLGYNSHSVDATSRRPANSTLRSRSSQAEKSDLVGFLATTPPPTTHRHTDLTRSLAQQVFRTSIWARRGADLCPPNSTFYCSHLGRASKSE